MDQQQLQQAQFQLAQKPPILGTGPGQLRWSAWKEVMCLELSIVGLWQVVQHAPLPTAEDQSHAILATGALACATAHQHALLLREVGQQRPDLFWARLREWNEQPPQQVAPDGPADTCSSAAAEGDEHCVSAAGEGAADGSGAPRGSWGAAKRQQRSPAGIARPAAYKSASPQRMELPGPPAAPAARAHLPSVLPHSATSRPIETARGRRHC